MTIATHPLKKKSRSRGSSKTAGKTKTTKSTAYQLFVKEQMPRLTKEYPDTKTTDKMKLVGKLWQKKKEQDDDKKSATNSRSKVQASKGKPSKKSKAEKAEKSNSDSDDDKSEQNSC